MPRRKLKESILARETGVDVRFKSLMVEKLINVVIESTTCTKTQAEDIVETVLETMKESLENI